MHCPRGTLVRLGLGTLSGVMIMLLFVLNPTSPPPCVASSSPQPPPPTACPTVAPSSSSPDPIPRLLHFAYCRPPGDNPPVLPFAKWLGMTSAVAQLRPTRILLHTEVGAVPLGFWWDQFAKAHGELLQVVEHDPVTSVYGHPIEELAHKTDVLRLDALYNHGGVYLDSDVLVFRDFLPTLNDHLRQHPKQDAVLIQERKGERSLGNAVIMSRPFSKFIALWKSHYHNFDDRQWSAHSTELPHRMSKSEPGASLLHQLPDTAFYSPDWDEMRGVGIKLFLEEMEPSAEPLYDFEAVGAMGWHWWGHTTAGLDNWAYTPCLLMAQANRTVVSRLMGRYVSPKLCQQWQDSLNPATFTTFTTTTTFTTAIIATTSLLTLIILTLVLVRKYWRTVLFC